RESRIVLEIDAVAARALHRLPRYRRSRGLFAESEGQRLRVVELSGRTGPRRGRFERMRRERSFGARERRGLARAHVDRVLALLHARATLEARDAGALAVHDDLGFAR